MAIKGKKFTEEHKKNLRLAHIGKPLSEEHKRKIMIASIGRKHSEKSRQKMKIIAKGRGTNGVSFAGRHHSEDTKQKIGLANRGNRPMLGKHHSEETRKKIGLGNKNRIVSEETRQKMRLTHWKGGKRLSILRNNTKRRLLGHDILNQEFEGSEGHHIDRIHVIFIPKELHRSVWHSLDKLETMEQINTKVFCWLLGKNNQ